MQIPGYREFGGKHPDSAAVRNLVAHAGVVAPHTGKPFTEAAVLGIAGGIGAGYSFCPSVPRYGFGGGVSVVARHLAYAFDGTFQKSFFARVGLAPTVVEASSPKAAHAKLVAELEKGRPVLVWCTKSLAYFGGGGPAEPMTACAWSLVVHAVDDAKEEVSVADLAPASLTVTAENLAAARNQVCTHKNRQLTLPATKPVSNATLAKAMLEGIRSTVAAQTKPRIRTFSLEGVEHWARIVANPKTKDGWPKTFPGGRMSWPLREVFQTIETEGTGGGLMRPMYADFLDEAAKATGKKGLLECAATYRELGKGWTALAEAALPDAVAPFKRTKQILREKTRLFGTHGPKALDRIAELSHEGRALGAELLREFPLAEKETLALLEGLRDRIVDLHAREKAAIEALGKAVA